MTCELRPGVSKPLDALLKYFLDVKPYHTKLLEVIERYKFNEAISVGIEESHNFDIIKKNLALCGPVGFGLVWDEECGFDAVECCDLFECIGGYGLIFDNSDLLVDLPIQSIDENKNIIVSGNHLFDRTYQIKNISSSNTLILSGDYSSVFNIHKLFLVVPYYTFDIVDISENCFFLSGNKVSEIKNRKDFRVSDSRYNDGVYVVNIVRYDVPTNRTEIIVNETLNTSLVSGYINVKSPNKNNGVYQVQSVTYNGFDTIITIRNNNTFNYISELNNGSVQIRSGLTAPRRVWLYNTNLDSLTEYLISNSRYDIQNDQTIITLAEDLIGFDDTNIYNGNIRLYGYRFGAGFDGFKECTIPKPFNINMSIGEVLNIYVETRFVPITPTPSVSITPSVTVTPSVSPSITPSLTPSPSPISLEPLSDAIMSYSPWAYYKLNELTGATQAVDYSGSGRNLGSVYSCTPQSTPLISEGTYSTQFNGSTNNIRGSLYGASILTDFGGNNQPYSMFCIINYSSVGIIGGIFQFGSTSVAGDQGTKLYIFNDNILYFDIYNGAFKQTNTTTPLVANTTYSLGAIRSASGGLQIYINGVANGPSISDATGSISFNGSTAITLGSFGNNTFYSPCRMQHIAFFNSDIGSAGITALHAASGL